MNIDIVGALFKLSIEYEYIQTQCQGGTSEVNIH